MKETILLADFKEIELLRTLAYHHQNTVGLRVFDSFTLAKEALIRNGIIVNDLLGREEEAYIIHSFLKEIPYFSSSTFEDSGNMADALYLLRSLIPEEEEKTIHTRFPGETFRMKNESITEVYDLYTKNKGSRKDRIDIIRMAIRECGPMNCEFAVLEEKQLTPLEEKLLDRLSSGSFRTVSAVGLFHKTPGVYRNIEYIRAYGNSNEVEDVIGYIYGGQIPLDSCTVAVSDENRFGSLFYEYSRKYDIPMTFGCGISIQNSAPAKLLKLYRFWDDKGYHGTDALKDMLLSPYFDLNRLLDKLEDRPDHNRLIENIRQIGNLKISADQEENRIRLKEYKETLNGKPYWYREDLIDLISEELGKGCSYFIREYALITDATIDPIAVASICDSIDSYLDCVKDGSYQDIFDDICSRRILHQTAAEGKLHICSIGSAFANLRDNLFVVGLSANHFPGSPKENYLLLDEDLVRMGGEKYTSDKNVERKKDLLHSLISLASALNMNLRLSYSSYGMSELKEENPSSVLFEIFGKQYAEEATVDRFSSRFLSTGYFDNRLSVTREVGLAFNRGEKILPEIRERNVLPENISTDKKFSPTNIETFFECPKKFYLKHILRIEEPDPDDPFVVIDARDLGTLAHSMMEFKANRDLKKEEFLSYCNTAFENFLKGRVPLHRNEAQREKENFMSMMSRAYDADPCYEVMAAEERIEVEHSSGITLYGYPDRVEKDFEGNYLIADFKTKRNFDHKENDILTCLQVVLYAYMIAHNRKNPLPVSRCEYRYLRYGKTIRCVYNNKMEADLDGLLKTVAEAIDRNEYPCSEEKNACRYCRYLGICGKEIQE